MFDAGTLKGAKKEKPSRAKSNPQLTQNQVSVCTIQYDDPSRRSRFSNLAFDKEHLKITKTWATLKCGTVALHYLLQ